MYHEQAFIQATSTRQVVQKLKQAVLTFLSKTEFVKEERYHAAEGGV